MDNEETEALSGLYELQIEQEIERKKKMAYEQKDNSGSLFANDKKASDTHPDYKGQIMVAGKMYWISGWKKVAKSGTRFMSLAVKPKESQEQDNAGDML